LVEYFEKQQFTVQNGPTLLNTAEAEVDTVLLIRCSIVWLLLPGDTYSADWA